MKILKNIRLSQNMIDAISRVCYREEITFTRFIEDGIKLNLKRHKEKLHYEKFNHADNWADGIN